MSRGRLSEPPPFGTSPRLVVFALALVLLASCTPGRFPLPKGLGEPAPDIEMLDVVTGETVTLAEYRGREVLLNVWATWCGPCRREMPSLDSLYRERDGTLAVLHASEEDIPTILRWMAETPTTARHLQIETDRLRGPYVAARQVKPTTFIIDADGILRDRMIGAGTTAEFRARLDSLARP